MDQGGWNGIVDIKNVLPVFDHTASTVVAVKRNIRNKVHDICDQVLVPGGIRVQELVFHNRFAIDHLVKPEGDPSIRLIGRVFLTFFT